MTLTIEQPPTPDVHIRSRVARIVWILTAFERQPRRWTRRAIATRYGLSERQIDKDIDLIRSLGYDLRHHSTGYELHGGPEWSE